MSADTVMINVCSRNQLDDISVKFYLYSSYAIMQYTSTVPYEYDIREIYSVYTQLIISNSYGISHEIYSRNIPMFFLWNIFTCFYEICFSMKYTHFFLWNILTFSMEYTHVFLRTYTMFCLYQLTVNTMWCINTYSSGLLHWHWGNHCPSASEVTLKNMGKNSLYLTTTKHKAWTIIIIPSYTAQADTLLNNSPQGYVHDTITFIYPPHQHWLIQTR